MMTVFVYSKLWVRSGAKSDIEFYELRYSGKAAAILRGFRSIYLGIVFNVITTGLVMLAAIKIGQVIFGIDQWTVIIITSIASIIYSALGGFRGAIYTDFFLFILIMTGAVVGMVYALGHPDVGGFSAMMSNPVVQKHLSFIPDVNNTDLFVAIFVIPIAIQWWNVWYPGSEPGGGGYIVQRMLSAKSENHCVGGSVLYQVINYAVRPWPWYLTAFASLIVFPDLASLQKAFPHVNPALVKGDLAYPAMLTFVPNGWLGVVAASMMGALFSTVAAHLSMGSNYIANDFWKRFVNPNATEKELIVVGRWTVIALMVMTAGIAPLLSSAGAVFNLILQIGAGTGLIYLLRWFWMRINAWSEVTAMAVSFLVAVFLQLVYPHLGLPPLQSWHRLIIVMVITTAAWVGVTLLTPPTEAAKRAAFQNKIRANGHDIAWGMLAMTVACVAIYSMMFAAGYWIYGRPVVASVMTAVAVVAGCVLCPILKNLNSKGK
jgi:Na+/proline symporter